MMIKTNVCPSCYLCGSPGQILYKELGDRLYGVLGQWQLRKCPKAVCGLIWLDPMPKIDEIPRLYPNYYTHGDDRLPSWFVRLYEGVRAGILACRYGYTDTTEANTWKLPGWALSYLRDVRDRMAGDVMWLDAKEGGRLLDIGCGSGKFLAFVRSLGWNVTGVEPDPAAVQMARDKYGLTVHQGFLADAKFPEGTFDVVTMNHVIEHLPDPIQTIRQVRRILIRGGKLVIATPNTFGLGHCLFGRDWIGLDSPRHLFVHNPHSLRSMIERAGLPVQTIHTVGRSASYFLTMSHMHKKAPLSDREITHSTLLNRIKKRPLLMGYYQIWEGMVLSLDPAKGEEILVFAQKE